MPALAEQHQAVQASLATLATRDLAKLWHLLNVANPHDTLPRFIAAVTALVHKYASASAAASSEFYTEARNAARVLGTYTPTLAPLPDRPQVESSVRWATHELWTPPKPAEGGRVVEAPTDGARLIDLSNVQTLTAGVVDKMVLDAGRDTVIENVHRDRKAKAWARIPEPGCCSFCALLATNGAVYKDNAFDQSNSQYRERLKRAFEDHPITPSDAKTHDHCRCHMEPVFNAYEPSAQIREWEAMYKRVPHGTPREMRREFRRIYEGRV